MTTPSTAAGSTYETTIAADPSLPTFQIVRDFDAPAGPVFRAWVEPGWSLDGSTTQHQHPDRQLGCSARAAASATHRAATARRSRPSRFVPRGQACRRLVQTFTWEASRTV